MYIETSPQMVHRISSFTLHYVALALATLAPALAQAQAAAGAGTAAGAAATAAANANANANATGPASTGRVTSVNIVGERQNNRIDRQVYDVKQDVSSTNGTAADALGNVPSVSVDPDGTVSLRGSSNVQILVDGKPSAMLQGDNRGPALQAMPSEDIDSIEVINNPGAEFGNEGGGGPILNLVMKRSRRAGGFGVVNANYGTAGRYNSAVNGSYNTGRWGMQGGVNVRHDGRNSTGEIERDQVDPVTGADRHSSQTSSSTGLNDSAGLRGQLTYNLNDADALEANVGVMKRTNDQTGLDRYQVDADGVPTSDYLRATRRNGDNSNGMGGLRWDHKGDKIGELFRMDLRVSRSSNDNDTRYANTYIVTPPNAESADSSQSVANSTRIVDYTGDYERPLDSGAILKLGYKIADNRSDFDTRYVDVDPLTALDVVNGRRTNAFQVDEKNVALYGSYQWKLSERWGALVGLRTEYTHLDLDQVTTALNATNSYLNWIPSAFATYKLGEKSNLRFAYAHRLRRASANQLNPFVVYVDELNESSGNPMLKPVQTDSFEIGYETKAGGLDANLRGYFRNDRDTIRSRQVVVGENILLTTLENGGSNRSGGLEFTLSGKLTPTLSINTSGNLAFTEQQQIDLNGAETRRSANSLSVRGRVNYQITPQDALQLMINAQGKTLAGTGYRQPISTLNLSWRRSITPALSLVMNVTDVFSSQKMETVTDSATLKERSIRRFDGRIAYVGLSWRFGGVPQRPRSGHEGPDGEGWRGGPPAGGPGGPGGGGFGPGGGGPGM
jgi:outer membrane receptor protein involved in Fe transport